ncbi:hypothetical protein PR048_013382 [Dryococelus australis]|uniref:Uncharacterized protein n=1 Tax=Dryococelus australis TaxID=614101 RepID=A0ABQ9HSF9_9NEOP|nr:hypothetical protein PR048_013382 [Dryococelus australis]
MEQHQNVRAGELNISKKTCQPATSNSIFTCKNQGTTPLGNKPGLLWWEWNGEIWVAFNSEVFRVDKGEARRSKEAKVEQIGDPREILQTSSIVRHDSHMRKSRTNATRNQTWFTLVGGKMAVALCGGGGIGVANLIRGEVGL